MPTATPSHTPSQPPPFEEHLRTALRWFRSALADITAEVGADATRPQQLARQLGLDKSLAWHLTSILSVDDLPAIVGHLPGKAGLRIAVSRFEDAGASADTLESLQRSIDEIERVISTHCGDRGTLEMMVGHFRGENGHAAQEEAHRKRLFQGASAIWGVQARMQLAAHFIAPSREDPEMLDSALISGLIGFRRLRPDVPWAVASVRRFADDGARARPIAIEPVDPGVGADDAPLLAEFCSKPLPALQISPGPAGVTRYEIVEGPVGNTAACTAVAGWIWRSDVSPWRSPTDQYGEHIAYLYTPAKLLVLDLFVHKDVPFNQPQPLLYSQLPGGPTYPSGGRDRGKLPLRQGLIDLGASPPDATTPEFPRHQKLVEQVCERLGWSSNEFTGYRLRLPYPPIPALATLRHELPEKPTA